MATRILAGWYLLGQDSGFPDTNFNSWISFLGSHVNVSSNHASYVPASTPTHSSGEGLIGVIPAQLDPHDWLVLRRPSQELGQHSPAQGAQDDGCRRKRCTACYFGA